MSDMILRLLFDFEIWFGKNPQNVSKSFLCKRFWVLNPTYLQ